MLWWIYIPEKLLALFVFVWFLCSRTTVWFILSSGPLLGAPMLYICYRSYTGRLVLPQGGCVVFCGRSMFGGLLVRGLRYRVYSARSLLFKRNDGV